MEVPEYDECRKIDVLCGRGAGGNLHEGNITLKRKVLACTQQYGSSSEKRLFTKAFAEEFYAEGVRFLRKNNNTGKYQDIGFKKSVDKTMQLFRDGPKIRLNSAPEDTESRPEEASSREETKKDDAKGTETATAELVGHVSDPNPFPSTESDSDNYPVAESQPLDLSPVCLIVPRHTAYSSIDFDELKQITQDMDDGVLDFYTEASWIGIYPSRSGFFLEQC